MTLLLRRAASADRDFLRWVYGSTRAEELSATGWDEARCADFVTMQFNAQEHFYQQQFPHAELAVIEWLREGKLTPVGRLWIDRRPGAIHVLDIALLAEYRGQGLGTECLGRLMAEAQASELPLTIKVECFNPARMLYERLGFVVTGEHGVHIAMAWRATRLQLKEFENEQA
jgi:ribosomal protein S18 acetylase RimI-like enzyme